MWLAQHTKCSCEDRQTCCQIELIVHCACKFYPLAFQASGVLSLAFMQGDEGKVIVHKDDPACFSCLLADCEAFLVSVPGMVIIATVTCYFPHDVECLRNPWLMRKFAEHCEAFLNERHGRGV